MKKTTSRKCLIVKECSDSREETQCDCYEFVELKGPKTIPLHPWRRKSLVNKPIMKRRSSNARIIPFKNSSVLNSTLDINIPNKFLVSRINKTRYLENYSCPDDGTSCKRRTVTPDQANRDIYRLAEYIYLEITGSTPEKRDIEYYVLLH